MLPSRIYNIQELTEKIRTTLEENFSNIWVRGEISNFHAHSSGHFYFTLKDVKSQISAVMFRGSNRILKFRPEDGLSVIAHGRVTVYGARGNYQIILEYLEPEGIGALQLAFEQLRDKLQQEGLFEKEFKKELPYLPRTVGVITSPTGAVLRDIVTIIRRRNPFVNILLYPVSVQGEIASQEIAYAIQKMNSAGLADVLIVGRGGGSLEDLWAFNTEVVARAIFASKIPIVSAVGHETDVTIADYVADLRAPTPSAAAELLVPLYDDLKWTLEEKKNQIKKILERKLQGHRQQLHFWVSHLKHPKRKLEDLQIHLDDLEEKIRLLTSQKIKESRANWQILIQKLEALSPLAILARGYSLVTQRGEVIRDVDKLRLDEPVNICFHQGEVFANIKK